MICELFFFLSPEDSSSQVETPALFSRLDNLQTADSPIACGLTLKAWKPVLYHFSAV